MTDYTVRFTDINTTPLTLPEDSVNRTSVDVVLFGRIFNNYGQDVNEDLLNILENFACPEAPGSTSIYDAVPDVSQTSKGQLSHPTEGQFWYNNTRELMYYRDDTEWVPIPLRGSYAANWGQLQHGQAIPRPINAQGYSFPYSECIWSVSPAALDGAVDFMNCNTDAAAVVNMQYRYNQTSTIVNGIANYLIIGIQGNTNNGIILPPINPIPTPTPSVSSTPAVSVTPTPAVTPTRTRTPATTPTPGVSSTPAPSSTPAASVTPTPGVSVTPTPAISSTPAPSLTPAASPIPPPPCGQGASSVGCDPSNENGNCGCPPGWTPIFHGCQNNSSPFQINECE